MLRKRNKKSKSKIIFLLNIEQNNFSHHSSTVSAGTCLQPASLATNPGSRLHPNGGCASRIIEIHTWWVQVFVHTQVSAIQTWWVQVLVHMFWLPRLGGSKFWFICRLMLQTWWVQVTVHMYPHVMSPSHGSHVGLCQTFLVDPVMVHMQDSVQTWWIQMFWGNQIMVHMQIFC